MKKWSLLLVLLLAGCWDVNEPERMLYLHGIGIDYQDGQYITYAQIIDFTNVAKSEQPTNPDAVQAEVGQAKGKNISEAMYKLYESIDERLFWGHFSYVVFSEEALADGRANTAINTFIRFHDTRYNAWIYSTKDEVKDVLLTTPIINKALSLSKLSDPYNIYQQDSFIEPMNFRKLILQLNEPSYEVKIPLISLVHNWETKKEQSEVTEISGVAVLAPSGLKGFIEHDEAQGLQWLLAETVRANMTVTTDDFSAYNLSMSITSPRVKVTPIIKNDTVTLHIKLQGIATLISFSKSLTTAQVKEAAAQQIEKEVRETFEAGLRQQIDIFRFSELVYRQHYPIWRQQQVHGQIPLTKNTIEKIDVHITEVVVGRKAPNETIQKR